MAGGRRNPPRGARSGATRRPGLRAKPIVALLALALAGLPAAARGQAEGVLLEEDFSSGVDGWSLTRLDRRPTAYATTIMNGNPVLVATSENAAAGYVRAFRTPAPARATLAWRWRVARSLADNGEERSRRGDDYAARVFALFGDRPFKRGTRAVSYVWAGREPPGSRYRNPVVSDVATFVIRSGDAYAERWMYEQRDLVADFRTAFGEDPPPLTGIAIVVDTDDTSSEAIAWFDDFRLEVTPRSP